MVWPNVVFGLVNALLYARHFKLVRRFRRRMGRWPDIARPRDYADRMFWRKAVDRNPLFVTMVDKLAAKDHVRACRPDLPIPETLWVGTDADSIPAAALSGDVWVKANHGCNFNYPIRDGVVDRDELRRVTQTWMGSVFGGVLAEWAYSQVSPRLFVERSVAPVGRPLWEIEIRAASGRFVLGSMVTGNKTPSVRRFFLDENGEPVRGAADAASAALITPPEGLDYKAAYFEAIALAARIGARIDYCRIDFFWDGERLLAGEVTIYPAGGFSDIVNPDAHFRMLSGWRLSESDFLKRRHAWPTSVYANALRRAVELEESARDAERRGGGSDSSSGG